MSSRRNTSFPSGETVPGSRHIRQSTALPFAPTLLVLHSLIRIPGHAEQVRQLLHAQAGDTLVLLLVKRLLDKGALLLLKLDDSVLYGARNEHTVDLDWSDLTDAVSTVNRLLLNIRVVSC